MCSPVRRLRITLDLSEAELAHRLGVTEADVRGWEAGELRAPPAVIDRVPLLHGGRAEELAGEHRRFPLASLDPLYADIGAALEGRIPSDGFEDCALALLRRDHPGLFPLGRSGDDGKDGAWVTPEGEWTVLLATTGDAAANLRQNLPRALSKTPKPTGVFVATNRPLSGPQQARLRALAEEHGIDRLSVFEQRWFVDELFRDPPWRLRLLGLSGAPRALSPRPPGRTTRAAELVGREDDLRWLVADGGDRLLLGSPGMGKTSLLRELIWRGEGLFVRTDDLGRIADEIRGVCPKYLIVDDAQSQLDLPRRLAALREEIGASFGLVISAWPTERERLLSGLSLPASAVHELQPLTRDEMVQVVRSVGLIGPDGLVADLVRQADGRPGLAVTLTLLCLTEGFERVRTGEALLERIGPYLDGLVGTTTRTALATFAVGGESGASIERVARYLGTPLGELRDLLDRLAAAGFLRDRGPGRVSVTPAALRSVLVRHVFFGTRARIDISPVLDVVHDARAATGVLLEVRGRGGPAPLALVLDRLRTSGDADAWVQFAAIGHEEAAIALDERPDLLVEFAKFGLSRAPEEYLTALLDDAAKDEPEPSFLQPSGPKALERIRRWIQDALPGRGAEPVRRRQLVAGFAVRWLKAGRAAAPALAALECSFDSRCEQTSSDPGSGSSFTIRFGLLTAPEVECILALWRETFPALVASPLTWPVLLRIARAWAHPDHRGEGDGFRRSQEALREGAKEMVRALVETTRTDAAVQYELSLLAQDLGVEVSATTDPVFGVLFPVGSVGDTREDFERWTTERDRDAQGLAERWVGRTPESVVAEILGYEASAARVGRSYPRLAPTVCGHLASTAESPRAWAEAMLRRSAAPELVAPFLVRLAREASPENLTLLRELLHDGRLKSLAVHVLLPVPGLPSDLRAEAVASAGASPDGVRGMLLREELDEATTELLLRHDAVDVVVAAIVGERGRGKAGSVRPGLIEVWRRAVIACHKGDPWLKSVFEGDAALAREWVQARLAEGDRDADYGTETTVNDVASTLPREARSDILRGLDPAATTHELVRVLVGDDPDIYEDLLSQPRLSRYRLAPLGRRPQGVWGRLAECALRAGLPAREIAQAPFYSEGWSGPESVMWRERAAEFEALAKTEQLKEVARLGVEAALANATRALHREREEAVHGGD